MKNKMKLMLILTIIFIGAGIFGWWHRPVKIGFIGELSGENAQMSVESREAFLYLVDQYNQKGGLLGRPIEPYVIDDHNNNSYKQDIARELKSKRIHFVIGFNLSAMAPTIRYLAKDGYFLIISPTVTTDELSAQDDQFIKLSPSNAKQIDALMPIIKRQNLCRMVIVYDLKNQPYTKAIVDQMSAQMMKENREVVAQVGISDSLNPEDLQETLIKTRADSLLLMLNGEDAGQLVQAARISGYNGPVLMGAWASTTDLIENIGRFTDDVYITGIANAYPDPEAYQLFAAHIHEKTKKTPNYSHTRAYNASKILFEGIQIARSFEPNQVKKAILEKATFEGIDTPIVLDKNGDRVGDYELLQIENGKFVRAK